MFGLGNDDDEERMWNFIIFKYYGTDDELNEVMPALGIIILLTIIGGLIWFILS